MNWLTRNAVIAVARTFTVRISTVFIRAHPSNVELESLECRMKRQEENVSDEIFHQEEAIQVIFG